VEHTTVTKSGGGGRGTVVVGGDGSIPRGERGQRLSGRTVHQNGPVKIYGNITKHNAGSVAPGQLTATRAKGTLQARLSDTHTTPMHIPQHFTKPRGDQSGSRPHTEASQDLVNIHNTTSTTSTSETTPSAIRHPPMWHPEQWPTES
jgi:hypothetical protein